MGGDPLGARGPLNLSGRLSVCRNERAAHWDAAYAKGDAGRSRFQAEAGPSLEAIGATGAGPDDAIIDVGGGSSRLVDGLLGRGFRDLTVLDVSSVALRIARARQADRAGDVTWLAHREMANGWYGVDVRAAYRAFAICG